ncbi:LacI family DNA-binding transcriptional regulator [Flindersiella endophytica]
MRESVEQRHERILRLVRERESVRVVELAAELGISVETARRDVTALADVGRLRRQHGSVAWPTLPLNARDARLARQAPRPAPSSLVLGLVVPVSGYFFQQLIQGARAAANAAGVRLLVGITDYSRARDTTQIQTMIEAGADGLLLTPSWDLAGPDDTDLVELAGLRRPVVLVERHIPVGARAAELDRVASDHAEGTALAVRHLAGLGHERIALLAKPTHTQPHIRRGYHAATHALALPDDDLSPPDDTQVGRLLELASAGDVRAAIVHTDVDAINLLQRLTARGLRVPDDFALISYDDEIAELADVPLTAIAPAKRSVGETAVHLLLRRLADPGAQHSHIDLVPELKHRASTRQVELPVN